MFVVFAGRKSVSGSGGGMGQAALADAGGAGELVHALRNGMSRDQILMVHEITGGPVL